MNVLKLHPELASSPGLQLCGGKAWYRLHAHALDFRILCRKIVRKRTGPQYPYVLGFCRFCRMLVHAHAVDTRPSFRIIEGLGTRLIQSTFKGAVAQKWKLFRLWNLIFRKHCKHNVLYATCTRYALIFASNYCLFESLLIFCTMPSFCAADVSGASLGVFLLLLLVLNLITKVAFYTTHTPTYS